MSGRWGHRRLDEEKFLGLLEKEGPPSSLFLAGPEVLLRDRLLERMRTAVFADGAGGRWSREVYQARETPLSDLTAGLRVVGLFAGTRLVVVSEPERYGRSSQADRSELWAWMDSPSPGIHLVLASEKPLWELERANEFVKGTLGRAEAVVHLDHPTYDRAIAIAREMAVARHAMNLTDESARRLVDAVGANLMEIANEIDRLALRLGDGATVAPEALENWLRSGTMATLEDLERAVFAGDAPAALRSWEAVRQKQSPPAATWMIGNKHLDPRWGSRGGGGPSERPFLSQILRECYRLERGVKMGEIPSSLQETAFEAMVLRLCAIRRTISRG